MSQLFASHLAKKVAPIEVTGSYDSEQDLWVGNNKPVGSFTGSTLTSTSVTTWSGTFSDGDVYSDSDSDYNPDH